jgi:uncharacterized protein with HEPN domain
MIPGPEGDALHLDHIVELIELIRDSLLDSSESDFLADRMMGDATALRLGSIGEASRKLSQELIARHPEIEWRKMYALRNIVATTTKASTIVSPGKLHPTHWNRWMQPVEPS